MSLQEGCKTMSITDLLDTAEDIINCQPSDTWLSLWSLHGVCFSTAGLPVCKYCAWTTEFTVRDYLTLPYLHPLFYLQMNQTQQTLSLQPSSASPLDQLWSLNLFLSVFSVIGEPSFREDSFHFCVPHKCVQLYLWECKAVLKKTLWRSVLSVWAKLKLTWQEWE